MMNNLYTHRGGSWLDHYTGNFRAHFRYRLNPDRRYHSRGFRCVYSINNDPSTSYRVLRGGSWGSSYTDDFRAHVRSRDDPDYGDDYLGFRCVYPIGDRDTNG